MDEKILNSLKELKIIEASQLEKIVEESKKTNVSLEDLLISRDLISSENLGKIKADILNLPYFSSKNISIDQETLEIIPEIVAKKQRIIAFKQDAKGLKVAMSDPSNQEIIKFLK